MREEMITARKVVSRNRLSLQYYKALIAYMVIVPVLAFFVIWVWVPVGSVLYFSVHDWSFLNIKNTFTGVENLIKMVHDEWFWLSVKNNIIVMAVMVSVSVPLSLVIAAGLTQVSQRARGVLNTFYFTPVVTSVVVAALVWGWIYDGSGAGLLNWFLSFFGIRPRGWILLPATVIPAVSVMLVWKWLGYNVVIFVAALLNIPQDMYESAKVDGASPWQLFRHITLPLVRPAMLFVAVVTMINSFQVFAPIWVLMGRSGFKGAYVLPLMIYREGIVWQRIGYASAISLVMFIFVLGLMLAQFRILRTDWEY
jgi:multiple sugar transport system permease protein